MVDEEEKIDPIIEQIAEGVKIKTPPKEKPPMKVSVTFVILVAVVIIIIMGLTLAVAQLIRANNQCVNNPFVYGANNMKKNGQQAYTVCSCVVDDEKITPLCECQIEGDMFYFDDNGIYKENPLTFFP